MGHIGCATHSKSVIKSTKLLFLEAKIIEVYNDCAGVEAQKAKCFDVPRPEINKFGENR